MTRAYPSLDDIRTTACTATISLLMVATALLVPVPAQGVQIVEASDGAALYLKVSKREITRIALDQGRIAALRVRTGELTVDPDEDTGQVFVSVPAGNDKPVNAFLTTAAGHTFTLLLQPVDIPADSIVLRPPFQAKRDEGLKIPDTHASAQRRLVLALAADTIPRDAELREVHAPTLLWKGVQMTLQRVLVTDSLVGERYIIVNDGNEDLVLEERELYRPGVNAIALDRLRLAPGDTAAAYVVRERNSHD